MTAWDVKREKIDRGYGHLPAIKLKEWCRHQTTLSESFKHGWLEGSSERLGTLARKREMMNRIEQALEERSNLSPKEITHRLEEASKYLEDPGLLENFEYFNVPDSQYMLGFYFAVWDRRIAEAMDYLHNYGKNLWGVPQKVPEYDIWYHMSSFEGMNIDKRKQAKDLVDFIRSHHITHATSFGGGNVPERLYGLPDSLRLTVFDNGPVSPVEELFPGEFGKLMVNYLHEPLSEAAKHSELFGTQGLVWMHGLSMYLTSAQMVDAILCAAALLHSDGCMRYDYLIWNYSMQRVISTQCWPNSPEHPLKMFNYPEDAIRQGHTTLDQVNAHLNGTAFMDIKDINVNVFDPWGATSVVFTVQKHG